MKLEKLTQQQWELFNRVVNAFTVAILDDMQSQGEGCNPDLQNAPFLMAVELGWDWEEDTEFSEWCLHATSDEILHEGIRRFTAWFTKEEENPFMDHLKPEPERFYTSSVYPCPHCLRNITIKTALNVSKTPAL